MITTTMDQPHLVHIQCKETKICNDTNKIKNPHNWSSL